MELIYGKDVAKIITDSVIGKSEELERQGEREAKLAIIRVGDNAGNISYERGAGKRMEKCGILHEEYDFPDNVSKVEFDKAFNIINADETVDGILLLRPLPSQLDEKNVVTRINPDKDVDCANPLNLGKLLTGAKDGFSPCTCLAVERVLKFILEARGDSLRGKNVTIVGRSAVVGRPLALLLINDDATVTVCHTKTENLAGCCKKADIIVAAAGHAGLITADHVKPGAIIADVGVNMGVDGKLVGDVDIESVNDIASVCTPVPGGIGAVTTSILAMQVMKARIKR